MLRPLPSQLLPRYEAALGGDPQSFEYRTHDGSRLYRVQLVPISGADRAVSSVVAVMQDITDRVRMTSDLARSEDGGVEAFHAQLVDITDRKERESRLEHDVGAALWLGRIRDALDEDRLVLYAQPIVDLLTGDTVQHELLLRMCGEDGQIIAPGEFLPAAERYGLVTEIDRWVIRQAVKIASEGVPTEFNLSGRSIGDPNILRELATAIRESGVDPSLLVVEVTETAFVGQT